MDNDRLTFTVHGEPVPKGRARSRIVQPKDSIKAFVRHYTPDATSAYEEQVKLRCVIAVNKSRWTWNPKTDRFALHVKVFRTHEGAGGDLDNYVKSVSDAINKVAFPDDRLLRHVAAWVEQDAARPRVEVQVIRFRKGERTA